MDANYPGGNIIVEGIEGRHDPSSSDLRDMEGWWFYWNFRVRGAQNRSVTFRFSGGESNWRPWTGGERRWRRYVVLLKEAVQDGSFRYLISPPTLERCDSALRFPTSSRTSRNFSLRTRTTPGLLVQELCKTSQGRSVERLHVGRLDGRAPHKVLLTARHHARGHGQLCAGRNPAAVLAGQRRHLVGSTLEFLAVSMDKDGVEQGDQGKNRIPRDHNRDYIGQSVHASVRSADVRAQLVQRPAGCGV